MRVLKISDVYFPRINGVSTSIKTFREEFLALGHEVTLIAPYYPGQSEDQGDIRRVDARQVLFDPEDRLMKSGPLRELVKTINPADYDIVHIHTPFVAHYEGLRMARRLKLPVVETYHTFFEEYFYNYIPFAPKRLLKFAARRFSATQCNALDGLVVPSTPMWDVLAQYGVEARKAVIPTGIDLEKLSGGNGDAFRKTYGIEPGRPALVHVGRVAHEKNIGFLIHMVDRVRRSVPDVLLIIAGEGPALKRLARQVEDLDLLENVLFVGYLDRDTDLKDCYRAGDAFVFASRTETQGLVLLEAMALGVPVVSTAIMGTKDVLKQGEGALIAEDDVEHFAGEVIRLLTEPGLREELAAKARPYAETWGSTALAEKMLAYYQEVIDSHA
ncbi:MAG: glycosyltransferase [Gammaproteobacteria bacterium]